MNTRAQSGGSIDASIVSVCLENLEDLNKKGINEEIVRNTASVVYVGRSRLSLSPFAY